MLCGVRVWVQVSFFKLPLIPAIYPTNTFSLGLLHLRYAAFHPSRHHARELLYE